MGFNSAFKELMRHLAYSVRYPVVLVNSSLFTITLYNSVRTTVVSNYTQYLSVVTL